MTRDSQTAHGSDRDRTDPYQVVHAILRLVGDHGARFERTYAACAVGGLPTPPRISDEEPAVDLAPYASVRGWTRDELIAAVDRLIVAGWVQRADTTEPTIELSKSGFEYRVMLERELRDRAGSSDQLQLSLDATNP